MTDEGPVRTTRTITNPRGTWPRGTTGRLVSRHPDGTATVMLPGPTPNSWGALIVPGTHVRSTTHG